MEFRTLKASIFRWSKIFLLLIGAMFSIILILSFTTAPFWMYFGLGTSTAHYTFKPDNIILLGGSGMPSEANLMRCETASSLWKKYPDARIVIALPKDQKEKLESSAIFAMRKELMVKGVDSTKIVLATSGHNTREQALEIAGSIVPLNEATVIVTSPEHMYRSLLTFRKSGLNKVGGEAAFERALESELRYNSKKLGGRKIPAPEIGDELQLRYQFWNHLKYQVICYREYTALFYYWLKDWI